MPLILPMKGEDQKNFYARCMGDAKIVSEYPDETQRFAVCQRQMELETLPPAEIEPTEKEQIVCVFPFGNLWLEDYQRWQEFTEAHAREVIANFENPDVIKPIIDKEHEYKESFGDIIRLFIDERNGIRGLFAEIKLNPMGFGLVKNRVYKGISPALKPYTDVKKQTHQNVLWALSLVNFQGLGTTTPSIQEQLELKKNIERDSMKNLAVELGISPDSGETQILEKIRGLRVQLESAQKEKDEKEKKIVEMETGQNEMNKIITTLQSKINELLESMKMAEEAKAEDEAEKAVEMGIQHGKIERELKEIYKKRYKTDRESFNLEMSVRKPLLNMQRQSLTGDSVEGISVELSAFMKKAGLDEKNQMHIEAAKKEFRGGK